MSQAKSYRRHSQASGWTKLLKGLGAAVAITAVGILVFSILLQWIKVSDEVIRVCNQVLKLGAIAAGVWIGVGRGGEKGLLRGALLGLCYMGAGVAMYALLSGQQLPMAAYLADLGMGVAAGGIMGMLLSNMAAKG